MARVFMKGCEAIAEAAVRSGCRFFAGYPITPQNEIPEYFARRMPEVGGVFVQGESELASVNMVYGAAQTGTRSMTSSSSTGVNLYSEGIAFMASARIPMVYVNVARGGPGIGSIQPSQQDYFLSTKAAGNGGFQMIVFAPGTVQEAADMTYKAFDYAQRDLNPVLILADGVIGTMMEPVELPPMRSDEEVRALKDSMHSWALVGHKASEKVLVLPGGWSGQEERCIRNKKLYDSWIGKEVDVDEFMTEDAEVIITGYGISGRIARSAVKDLRAEGYKIGLIRPRIISPFPYDVYENLNYNRVHDILDVEMSIPAQFVWDVKMAVKDRAPITECLRSGGEIISKEQIMAAARGLFK